MRRKGKVYKETLEINILGVTRKKIFVNMRTGVFCLELQRGQVINRKKNEYIVRKLEGHMVGII